MRDSTATRADYLDTLVNSDDTLADDAVWVALGTANGDSNWNSTNGTLIDVVGRNMNAAGAPQPPENTVEEIIEPAKIPRNPFNGGSIFLAGPNDPTTATGPIPGALACAVAADAVPGVLLITMPLYSRALTALMLEVLSTADVADYYAGQGVGAANLAGVREGVFFTKVRQ